MQRSKEIAFWEFIQHQLKHDFCIAVLYVIESNGSSPGRKGFKMAVSKASMHGSIGGGMMEHKWVEYARKKLHDNDFAIEKIKQFHSKEVTKNQSGMICSGDQTNAILYLSPNDTEAIDRFLQKLTSSEAVYLGLSNLGFDFNVSSSHVDENSIETELTWHFIDNLNIKPSINIIGGGHCAMALSRIMRLLDFHVCLYDTRKGLNTFDANTFAHEKVCIADYSLLHQFIPNDATQYTVIMTFGYRTDKIALESIFTIPRLYLGILGSKHKIKTMFEALEKEGFAPSELAKIHAPIGLPIHSKTPEEIAISIAAQIIQLKNKG